MVDRDQMFSNSAYVHTVTHETCAECYPSMVHIYMSRQMVKHLLACKMPRVLILVLYLVTCLENLDSWWHRGDTSTAICSKSCMLLHQDMQMECLDLCEAFSGKGVTSLPFYTCCKSHVKHIRSA